MANEVGKAKRPAIEGELIARKVDGFAPGARPLCVFCSAPWSDGMIRAYDLDAGDHCASGRFYAECCTVEIICHACKRLIYRKEGFELR